MQSVFLSSNDGSLPSSVSYLVEQPWPVKFFLHTPHWTVLFYMQIICALECENVLVWHCVLQRHLFQLCMHRCCCRTSAAINNQHLACWGSPVPSLLCPCLSTLVFTSAGSHDSYHRNFGAWHQQSQEWSSFLKGLRVQENKACSWGEKHVSHNLRESIKRLLYFFMSFTNTGRY